VISQCTFATLDARKSYCIISKLAPIAVLKFCLLSKMFWLAEPEPRKIEDPDTDPDPQPWFIDIVFFFLI
jgi:hypothetical protein